MSLKANLGFEGVLCRRAPPVGLAGPTARLSFPFPGPGVLKPDLDYTFFKPTSCAM